MIIEWTLGALADLDRIGEFVEQSDPLLADRTIEFLLVAPELLPDMPRIGERSEKYDPREVRRFIAGSYEMHYEIKEEMIYILRLWHTRESR